MGIVDKTEYLLKCISCNISEKKIVHQKGSSYGASWNYGIEFENFKVEWVGGDKVEPSIKSAKCNKCSIIPNITSGYIIK
jgi:hypothetical protein